MDPTGGATAAVAHSSKVGRKVGRNSGKASSSSKAGTTPIRGKTPTSDRAPAPTDKVVPHDRECSNPWPPSGSKNMGEIKIFEPTTGSQVSGTIGSNFNK